MNPLLHFWLGATVDVPLKRSVLALEFPHEIGAGVERWHLYRTVRSRGQLQLTYRLGSDTNLGGGGESFSLRLSDADCGIDGHLFSSAEARYDWRRLMEQWAQQIDLAQPVSPNSDVHGYPLVVLFPVDDCARHALDNGTVLSALLFQHTTLSGTHNAIRTARKSFCLTDPLARGQSAFRDAIKAARVALGYPYLVLTMQVGERRIAKLSLRLHSAAFPIHVPWLQTDTGLLPGERLCLCTMNARAVR